MKGWSRPRRPRLTPIERGDVGQPANVAPAVTTASMTAADMPETTVDTGADPFPRDAWTTLTGHAAGYLRLTVALLRDPAVSKHRRAALLAAAAYFASPIDLIPGIVPVLGQVDDLAVAMLAIRLALNALEPGRRQMHLAAAGLTDEALHDDLIAAGRLASWAARAGVRTGLRAGRGAIRFTVRGGRAATDLAMRSGRAAGRRAAPVADRLSASRHDASARIRRRLARGPMATEALDGEAIAGEVEIDGLAREPSASDDVGHHDGAPASEPDGSSPGTHRSCLHDQRVPATLRTRPDRPEDLVSDRTRPLSMTTRRARREAERRATRGAPTKGSAARSPIVWITVAALITGIVLIAALIIANGSANSSGLTPPSDPTPIKLADGRAIGAADAPATLDVWADFQCPGCGIFTRATEARIVRDYVASGKLRLVFHDYAFIGQESIDAAVAARAADAQGAFWPYHDWLFANQGGENKGAFRRDVLVAIAKQVGLDVNAFEAALDDPGLAAAVRTETASGAKVPVKATPTLVIGDQVIQGVPAWDSLSATIEAQIAKASGGSPPP